MTIKEFETIIINDVIADEVKIKDFINKNLDLIPTPLMTVSVNCNTYIERIVKISKEEQPFDLNRLSYIPYNRSHLCGEGRFNKKEDPVFYAAFTDLETPTATKYFLATEVDHSLLTEQEKTFSITGTKWLSLHSFDSAFIVFKEDYCQNNLIKSVWEEKIESADYQNLDRYLQDFLQLLSDECAKKSSTNGYKISNIIFDYFKDKGYKSIIYPGVRSQYRGNNIAMLPEIVDNNWQPKFGAEFLVTQNGIPIKIENIYFIDIDGVNLIYREIQSEEEGENVIISK